MTPHPATQPPTVPSVGVGTPGTAETGTGPQITAEDVAGAVAAKDAAWQAGRRLGELDVITAVLASTLRPGGLVARAVAAELERHVAGLRQSARQTASRPLGNLREAIADDLSQAAAEWREGKR